MILKYLGPFRQDGTLKNATRLKCKCDYCGTIWETSIHSMKHGATPNYDGRLCRICSLYGEPLMPIKFIERYPFVLDVLTFGSRGDVYHKSKILCLCHYCGKKQMAEYRRLKRQISRRGHYCCHACNGGSNIIKIYPQDIIGILGIVDINYDTLGRFGQVNRKTQLIYECIKCNKQSTAHYEKIAYGEHTGRCHSCAIKDSWADPHSTRKVTHSKSKGEKALLNSLQELGEDNLKGNIQVGSYRPDIVDEKRQLIIEYFGDYWHCNPQKYNADALIQFRGNFKKVKDIWRRDAYRNDFLKSLGYDVYIVWENDWNNNSDQVLNDVLDWIRDHKENNYDSTPNR